MSGQGWCDCSGRPELEVGSVYFYPPNRRVQPSQNLSISASFVDRSPYPITKVRLGLYVFLLINSVFALAYALIVHEREKSTSMLK